MQVHYKTTQVLPLHQLTQESSRLTNALLHKYYMLNYSVLIIMTIIENSLQHII